MCVAKDNLYHHRGSGNAGVRTPSPVFTLCFNSSPASMVSMKGGKRSEG